MTFKELTIGQSFDFIGPDRMRNHFFHRCEKISARKYRDEYGIDHAVGTISCNVYHVRQTLPNPFI